MELVVVGFNHRTAPLEFRERLTFSPEETRLGLQSLVSGRSLAEAELISTCNRTEIHAAADDVEQAAKAICELYTQKSGMAAGRVQDALYIHRGQDAVRHLFRLASSLDSMVVGEPQITKQLKEALQIARGSGTVKGLLERLISHALSVSKRVRSETGISRGAVSIPFAAVELAKRIFDHLEGKSLVVLGTGEMGAVTAKNFCQAGVRKVTGISRSRERASVFVAPFNGHAATLPEMQCVIAQADIFVACSRTEGEYLVSADLVRRSMLLRREAPLFFIDIAVPRNLDPKINDIDSAYLYDIDDLSAVVRTNKDERQRDALLGEDIIEDETRQFMAWLRTLKVKPVIAGLQQRADTLVEDEYQKALRRLPTLSEREQVVLRSAIRSAIQKLLYPPIKRLREEGEQGDPYSIAALAANLFALEDSGEPAASGQVDKESRDEHPARTNGHDSRPEQRAAPARKA